MGVFNLRALKSNSWKAINHSEDEKSSGTNVTHTENGYTIWFHRFLDVLTTKVNEKAD